MEKIKHNNKTINFFIARSPFKNYVITFFMRGIRMYTALPPKDQGKRARVVDIRFDFHCVSPFLSIKLKNRIAHLIGSCAVLHSRQRIRLSDGGLSSAFILSHSVYKSILFILTFPAPYFLTFSICQSIGV